MPGTGRRDEGHRGIDIRSRMSGNPYPTGLVSCGDAEEGVYYRGSSQ